MLTEEQVRESLEEVLVPGINRSLVGLNMVRQVIITDQTVNVTLASTALDPQAQDWVRTETQAVVRSYPK